MGCLTAFENATKAKLSLALVISSAHCPLSAAGSGVLPGEVVFSALWRQHVGAEGRRRSEQDWRVWTAASSQARLAQSGTMKQCFPTSCWFLLWSATAVLILSGFKHVKSLFSLILPAWKNQNPWQNPGDKQVLSAFENVLSVWNGFRKPCVLIQNLNVMLPVLSLRSGLQPTFGRRGSSRGSTGMATLSGITSWRGSTGFFSTGTTGQF